jgi:hypothetical protein
VLYATLFSWAGRAVTLELPGFEISGATLLADPGRRALSVSRDNKKVTIHLPGSVRPADMPVVRLECEER